MNMTLTTKDGFSLFAEYNNVSTDNIVIFIHGITSSTKKEKTSSFASYDLNRRGVSTLLVDLRANGRSSGDSVKDFTISGGLEDIQTAMQFSKKEKYTSIGLLGASFGGGLVSIYAGNNQNDISKLFLTNPAIDFNSTFIQPKTAYAKKQYSNFHQMLETRGFVEVGTTNKTRFGAKLFNEMKLYKPYKYLSKYQNPLMIVQGTNDKYIDHEHTKVLFDSLLVKERELVLLNGAEHGFSTEPYQTQVKDYIVNFFSK